MEKRRKLLGKENSFLKEGIQELTREDFLSGTFGLLLHLIKAQNQFKLHSFQQTEENQQESELLFCVDSANSAAAEIQRAVRTKEQVTKSSDSSMSEAGYPISEECLIFSDGAGKQISTEKKYSLFAEIFHKDGNWEVIYQYQPEFYTEGMVDALHMHWQALLRQLDAQPGIQLTDVNLVTEKEKALINEVNQTEIRFSDLTIHGYIEKNACRYEELAAFVTQQGNISYQELNQRANQLARYLQKQGVKQGDFIPVVADRRPEIFYGILAIMKLGAAYVPLSLLYPKERIQFMLEDSQAKLILATNELLTERTEVPLVDLTSPQLYQGDAEDLNVSVSPQSTAALIYTSGTTGRPKGVLIRHDTVVNYAEYNLREFSIDTNDRIPQFAPFTFSTAIYEITATLFAGAQLHIVSDEMIKDVRSFVGYVMQSGITIMLMSPEYAKYMPPLANVRIIETGASECQLEVSQKIAQFTRHVNAYGLTEGAIVTVWQGKDLENRKCVPIGKPVSNTKAYILRGNQLCGLYMPGELCVTGIAVADGYLNLPKLTAEKFVDNPFGEGKMLRTGDIVQWNVHGEIEYLSRQDFQVQIRGMRVELGEIEHVLRQQPQVNDATVISHKNERGDTEIIAFVCSEEQIDLNALKSTLNQQLIDYMIPAFVHQIPGIPLTINGKIDQQTLTGAHLKLREQVHQSEEELTETEEKVSQLFQIILEIKQAELKTNFLNEGGHSLKIIELLGEIESVFGISLKPMDVFENPTVKQLSECIEKADEQQYQLLPKTEYKEYYALSPAQRRIYFIQQLDPQSTAYNLPLCLKIDGKLESEYLFDCLDQLVARYEILRTAFIELEGEPYQMISPEVKVSRKLTEISQEDLPTKLKDFVQPFDMEEASLMHVELLKVNENEHYLLADLHHAIMDGFSLELLAQGLTDIYAGKDLPTVEYQYRDYSEWLNQQELQTEEEYWQQELSGEHEHLDLPLDYPRPETLSFNGRLRVQRSNTQLAQHLTRLTKETGTTDFMVLLAALMVLLERYSNQEEIILGSPVAARSRKELKEIPGMFINTIALKGEVKKEETFLEFLNTVKQTCVGAFEHQKYPFDELVQKLGVPRSRNHNPLFDIMFSVQDFDHQILQLGDTANEIQEIYQAVSKFDMTWMLAKKDMEYELTVEYCSDLFKEETIHRFMEQYLRLLDEMITYPTKRISEYILLEEEEYKQYAVPNKPLPQAEDTSELLKCLEKNAAAYAKEAIVYFEEQTITYDELNAKANQLAWFLRSKGVQRNDLIPLYMERSPEMLVAILGVVKAGGTYVALNDTLPLERIRFILEETQAEIMLTNCEFTDFSDRLEIFSFADDLWANESRENPPIVNVEEDGVYCLYTSGTTGEPKGVIITHASLFACLEPAYPFMEKGNNGQLANNKMVSLANYTFDMFCSETWLPLVHGAPILLANDEQAMNQGALNHWLQNFREFILNVTPSKLKLLIENPNERQYLAYLRTVLFGGEKLDEQLIERVTSLSDASIFNGYGPTEGSVFVSCTEDLRGKKYTGSIGYPNPNVSLYLLSGDSLCGTGMKGEICIAGSQVAQGYLNRPDLTEEAFLPNPFGTGRMYRTGDMGRWLPDGSLQYLQRKDDQIKIRGFRVELGEIEKALLKQPEVLEAAVICQQTAEDQEIIAYVVAAADFAAQKVRENLKKVLPYYMVPAAIEKIVQIPVTTSGKLDKKALPKPEYQAGQAEQLPQNATEQTVADIFAEVLEIHEVHREDDFFALGGHSLKMNRAANRIESQTGVRIPLQKLFSVSTVQGIAELIDEALDTQYTPIPQAESQFRYPASSVQERLYVLNQREGDMTAYNMPIVLKITGNLDKEKLQLAFTKLIQHQEILRTGFTIDSNQIYQEITEDCMPHLEVYTRKEDDLATNWQEQMLQQFIRPFDLAQPPLIRLGVLEVSAGSALLVLDIHHIISDAVSVNQILEELIELYQGQELEPLKLHYKDYSEWLQQIEMSEQEAYWLSTIEDEIPVLELPLDHVRPTKQSFKGKSFFVKSSQKLKKQVEDLSRRTGSTEYMILLAGFMTLLSRYSRQEDMLVGTVVSGRNHPDIESMLGMFVNTLVLRGKPATEKTFLEFLAEVSETSVQAYAHQNYPLTDLIEKSNCKRSAARNPLFDVMFVMQDTQRPAFELEGLKITSERQSSQISKFDLTLSVTPHAESYEFELEYCSDLFKESTMQHLLRHFETLVLSATAIPEAALGELNMLTPNEKHLLAKTFNQTAMPLPSEKTVVELFEGQVEKSPRQSALVFGSQVMSYTTLNEQANQVAHGLLQQGLKKEQTVALLMERGPEMFIAILAILKAGGAYVPIDPAFPQERIDYMLEDCQPLLVLTNCSEISIENRKLVQLEDIRTEDISNPIVKHAAQELAYCIYTSGTTGQPKGVLVEHQGLVNLSSYLQKELQILPGDNILQFANYTFDASIWEWTMALTLGASLHLITAEQVMDVSWLKEYIETYIDIVTLPPQYAVNLHLSKPRVLITAGSEAQQQQFAAAKRPAVVINAYGPTETTVCSSMWQHKRRTRLPEVLPIGTPVANSEVYVLQNNQLAGVDVPGEMCVAGVNIARGYLNQPELTAEKFVDNPFGKGKMYRTGDAARWRGDGNLEYLGRMDKQLKIRGFRIEPQEIEAALRSLSSPLIKDAAVIPQTNQGETGLAAYIVADTELDLHHIRSELAKRLPEYMIPNHMKQIPMLPLNANGKLDLEALPVIVPEQADEYRKAADEQEKLLIQVFEEVLNAKKISLNQNFFELGGDSIKAIRIVSKMRENGYELTVKNIMDAETLEELARMLQPQTERLSIDQGEVTGAVERTPIQETFFRYKLAKPEHFNQAVLLEAENIDQKILEQALTAVVQHHDQLRGVYPQGEQTVRDSAALPLYHLEVYKGLSTIEIERFIIEHNELIQRSIDLERGPLLQAALYQGDQNFLFLCVHHLVVDSVSWQILLEDLETAYLQIQRGKSVVLPRKTTSFKAWAQHLRDYQDSSEFDQEKTYWQNVEAFTQIPQAVEEKNEQAQFEVYHLLFDEILTNSLLYDAGKAYNTEINDLLLTALSRTVKSLWQEESLTIRMESHGRHPLSSDLLIDRTVGWFTATYPVSLTYRKNVQEGIIEIKEMLRNIPNHGIGYGLLAMKEDSSRLIEPSFLSFNYLGQIDNEKREGSVFYLSELFTGLSLAAENNLGTAISMDGQIYKNCLQFNVRYDASQIAEETIRKFCEGYLTSLQEVVAHCISNETSTQTISDFGLTDFESDEIEVLNELLDDLSADLPSVSDDREWKGDGMYESGNQ